MKKIIIDMETAAQGMSHDYLINPKSVEHAFNQHVLLLTKKRELKEISFKDFVALLAICSFTTKIAIEKSKAEPNNFH